MSKLPAQKKKNLQAFIRQLSSSEISVLASNFMKQSGMDILKRTKEISQKCFMVTISMQGAKTSGYGRCEEEANMNAYKNFFDTVIDNDEYCLHLSAALHRIKESNPKAKRPPRDKNDIMFTQNSLVSESYEKNGLSRILQTSVDMNKSKQNNSLNGSYHEERKRDQSKSKLRQILGRSFHDYEHHETGAKMHKNGSFISKNEGSMKNYGDDNKSRSKKKEFSFEKNSKSKDKKLRRSRAMSRPVRFIEEPHDCIYRSKYKKYKEETHKLSILVEQLQKKLKKYHDENRKLKSFLKSTNMLDSTDLSVKKSHEMISKSSLLMERKKKLERKKSRELLKKMTKNYSHGKNLDRKMSKKYSYHDLGMKRSNSKLSLEDKENIIKTALGNDSNIKISISKEKSLRSNPAYNELNESVFRTNQTMTDPHHMDSKMDLLSKKKPSIPKYKNIVEEEEDMTDLFAKQSEENRNCNLIGYHDDSTMKHSRMSDSNLAGSYSSMKKKERKRVNVPKLKLEVLPNYHGKFNKSINHLFKDNA